MIAESAQNREYIVDFLDSSEPLDKTELIRLSTLPPEDLAYLKQNWAGAEVKRRRQIIAHLIKLSATEFRLDFSSVFFFCLNDPDHKVRAQAVQGLGEEENYRYISLLIKLFKGDSSEEVRVAAAAALGKLALLAEIGKLTANFTTEVYNALLSVLDNKAESNMLRGVTLEAIAPLNLPKVKGLIEESYHSSDKSLRIAAIHAMGISCHPMWLTALIDELKNPDEQMRYESTLACGEIGDDTAVPYLINLLKDKSPRVQEAAVKALGETGSDEARESIEEILSNPNQKIRQAVRLALKELDLCQDPLSADL
jgi:HEAT repeat protein